MLAFSILGLAAVIQATITLFALKTANENVQRSRLANELYTGFIELLSQKHRLRLELTNALVGFDTDPQQRQVFYSKMLRTLDNLDNLTAKVYDLNIDDAAKEPEHKQRLESLKLLRKGVLQVGDLMETDSYARKAASLQEKRLLLTNIFDITDEQDLRATLLQSISRERLATERDRAAADVSLQFMNYAMTIAIISVVAFVFMLSRYFYLAFSRPIDQLMVGAAALKKGDLDHRIPESGNDEFSDLARSMNGMASEIAQLRIEDKRIKSQLEAQVKERTSDFQETLHRLEKVDLRRKQMFADISHELRTPTTAILGEAEITLRYNTSNIDDYRTTLEKIVNYSHALSRVIDDILTLARSDIDAFVLDKRPLQFDELCALTIKSCQATADDKEITVSVTKFPPAQVLGDAQRLEQVLRIGLENAIAYTPSGGKIAISTTIETDKEKHCYYKLCIRNEGPGISAAELPRVFDRHFRGAYAQSVRTDGSGLGLPLASTIIRAHQGHIDIHSHEGEYTELKISMPILESIQAGAP